MMLAVLLLSVIGKSTPSLVTARGRNIKFSEKKNRKAALAEDAGWYFVKFHSAPDMKALEKEGITIKPINMIMKHVFSLYLEPNQVQYLQSGKFADLQRLKPSEKIIKQKLSRAKTTGFMVETSDNFVPPRGAGLSWTKIRDGTFSVQYEDYDKALSVLASMNEVYAVTPSGKLQQRNNMASGWTQYNDLNHKVESGPDGTFYKPHVLDKIGLNGNGSVVTILDSWLDINLTWFYDPEHPNPPTDKYEADRRKVVYWEKHTGPELITHGTHVAATIAGSASANESSPAHLYDGVATGAKLAFIDYPSENMLGFTKNIQKALDATGSKITTNSWGDSDWSASTHAIYDSFAYENSDKVVIFANANDGLLVPGGYGTLSSPETAKNILSVGALAQIPADKEQTKGNENVFTIIGPFNWPAMDAYLVDGSMGMEMYIQGSTDAFIVKMTKNMTSEDFDRSCIFVKNLKTLDEEVGLDKAQPQCILLWEDDSAELGEAIDNVVCPVLVVSDPELWDLNFIEGYLEIRRKYRSVEYGEPIGIADFTSKGPSNIGVMKPDIVAPGSGISSATSTLESTENMGSVDDLIISMMSGCSMAAPNIAGAMAIIEQFYEQGWYHNRTITPSGSLMKATIISASDRPMINSTKDGMYMSATMDVDYGHGWPNLGANLPTGNNNVEMLIADNVEIQDETHLVGEFTVTDVEHTLRVTMSYFDPTLNPDSPIPLLNDLNLWVEGPKNEANRTGFWPGNQHEDATEEHYSTSERVLISKEEYGSTYFIPGTYKVHVTSKFHGSEPVKFAICIIGNVKSEGDVLTMTRTTECLGGSGQLGFCNKTTGLYDCIKFATGGMCQSSYNFMNVLTSGSLHVKLAPFGLDWFEFMMPEEISKWKNLTLIICPDNDYGMITYFRRDSTISYDPWDYESIANTAGPHIYFWENDGQYSDSDQFTIMIRNNGPVSVTYSVFYKVDEPGDYPRPYPDPYPYPDPAPHPPQTEDADEETVPMSVYNALFISCVALSILVVVMGAIILVFVVKHRKGHELKTEVMRAELLKEDGLM